MLLTEADNAPVKAIGGLAGVMRVAESCMRRALAATVPRASRHAVASRRVPWNGIGYGHCSWLERLKNEASSALPHAPRATSPADFGLAVFFDPKKLPRTDLGLEGT